MALKSNILILEDEPLIRLTLLNQVAGAGFAADAAGCCTDALRLMRGGTFDAGVFDYRLPDGDAVALIRTLRAEGRDLPVILLSAESDKVGPLLAEELGVTAVLSKPPILEEVLSALKSALADGRLETNRSRFAGPYRVWAASTGDPGFFDHLDDGLHIVVDCSGWGGEPLDVRVETFLQTAGDRAALCGAVDPLRTRLCAQNRALVCIGALDELAALSRRPSSPAEREALLESVVRAAKGGVE